MINPNITFLAVLILFHSIADFVLVREKNGINGNGHIEILKCIMPNVLAFSIPSAIVTFFYVGLNTSIFVFLIFSISHLIIDIIKIRYDTLKAFVLDQIAHISLIIAVWSWLFPWGSREFSLQGYLAEPVSMCIIVVLLGYISIFIPASIFISKLIEILISHATDDQGGIPCCRKVHWLYRTLFNTYIYTTPPIYCNRSFNYC